MKRTLKANSVVDALKEIKENLAEEARLEREEAAKSFSKYWRGEEDSTSHEDQDNSAMKSK